jgi:hypothetical protein
MSNCIKCDEYFVVLTVTAFGNLCLGCYVKATELYDRVKDSLL